MSGKVLIYPHKHEKITLYLHISECFIQNWSIFLFVCLRSLYCHFEKNPIFLRKISFREKSYFFQKKTRFSHDNHCMFTVPVHSASQWKSFDWRLHWEKCGEILFFSKILCFLGKCEENLVFLKKFSIFLKSLYSHFEKMWRKYCPFLQN